LRKIGCLTAIGGRAVTPAPEMNPT
jgi:hypothetical protein